MAISSKTYRLEHVFFSINEKEILSDVSLNLQEKEIVAVIGTSGAGKTTLLRLLAGLEQPTKGTILLKDQPIKTSTIALVPQDYGLLPWQTTKQAIQKAAEISRKRKLTEAEKRMIKKLFEQMKLTEVANSYPGQLSGGQRQRVAITRALASQSDVLLMDEPFSALDALTREKAQQLFFSAWQETPRLTVFVTHDIEEALLLADEILVMGVNGTIKKKIRSPFTKSQKLADRQRSEQLFHAVSYLRKEIDA